MYVNLQSSIAFKTINVFPITCGDLEEDQVNGLVIQAIYQGFNILLLYWSELYVLKVLTRSCCCYCNAGVD
jgi:hypothetical protein